VKCWDLRVSSVFLFATFSPGILSFIVIMIFTTVVPFYSIFKLWSMILTISNHILEICWYEKCLLLVVVTLWCTRVAHLVIMYNLQLITKFSVHFPSL